MSSSNEATAPEESQSGPATGPSGLRRYLNLLSAPGALRLSVAALLARLPSGMTALLLVSSVARATGSYAQAGTAAACYAVGVGVSGPVRGRAVDRRGARRVLLIAGCGQAVGFLALLAALAFHLPRPLILAVALAIGLLLPPVSPVMRTMWRRSLPEDELRAAAFAMESVVVDMVYIVGPSLVTLLLLLSTPAVALGVNAVLLAGGCLVLASAPTIRDWPTTAAAERHWLGPLRTAGVRWMLPIGLLATGSISGIEVALLASAGARGHSDLGGLLVAVFSVGGVCGGLLYGSRNWRGTTAQHLRLLLLLLASGYFIASLLHGLWWLVLLFLVTGLALAPMMTAQFTAMEQVAPEESMTESFAWLNALGQAGGALAASAVGLLITNNGPDRAFLIPTAMAALAATLTFPLRTGPERP
ncbi:MFS transporter [Streptomyces huiliensis]|uniref:MFS transporter n=1 Tax=Streptomyces huiliensis TaxID=2876027 RepID=UPI001CC068FF|nr:MFS transporter [Streptomyces huiliensis]MBZ4319925.1 MFS transporter [Streptomyces huiliensis]